MRMGKVIIIGGNKRVGKTTLTMKLHKNAGFNYFNYDNVLDSLEETFELLNDSNEDKYIILLENMVKRSLEDAKNYGINTVYEYIFMPKQLKNFKYKDQVEIIFLANLDANEDNVLDDFKKYSKSFDWPSIASTADLLRNKKSILEKNKILKQDCETYNFKLLNTSRGDNREKILDEIYIKLVDEKKD